MTLQEFNSLNKEQATQELLKCCGSTNWCKKLIAGHPYRSVEELKNLSDISWNECTKDDILEAFSHHPKIGDITSLEKKFASTKEWASGEQSGTANADKQVIMDLAKGNDDYENKFGYIFIVCATGKSADEMLSLLQKRLVNLPADEIKIAASEQNKITHLRIEKLLT